MEASVKRLDRNMTLAAAFKVDWRGESLVWPRLRHSLLPVDFIPIQSIGGNLRNAFRSPTDNLISPCSMRILKNKKYVGDPQQQCMKSDINGKENEGS
ncbi:unnamed protein product [Ranitomeya imitator]|uniref:Uncharacterized protein n=1 Tax=Ranitomeya imitator TaxID=111125 RepID=A0ABN9L807_9NEOB|nr:unnamed protein product [Ranitomeya imitator]